MTLAGAHFDVGICNSIVAPGETECSQMRPAPCTEMSRSPAGNALPSLLTLICTCSRFLTWRFSIRRSRRDRSVNRILRLREGESQRCPFSNHRADHIRPPSAQVWGAILRREIEERQMQDCEVVTNQTQAAQICVVEHAWKPAGDVQSSPTRQKGLTVRTVNSLFPGERLIRFSPAPFPHYFCLSFSGRFSRSPVFPS